MMWGKSQKNIYLTDHGVGWGAVYCPSFCKVYIFHTIPSHVLVMASMMFPRADVEVGPISRVEVAILPLLLIAPTLCCSVLLGAARCCRMQNHFPTNVRHGWATFAFPTFLPLQINGSYVVQAVWKSIPTTTIPNKQHPTFKKKIYNSFIGIYGIFYIFRMQT